MSSAFVFYCALCILVEMSNQCLIDLRYFVHIMNNNNKNHDTDENNNNNNNNNHICISAVPDIHFEFVLS